MIYTLVVKNGEAVEKILTFDCINGFTKSMSGTVIKTPVENGFPISDHISLENIRFDLSGIITSYSILGDDLELRWNGSYFETVGDSQDRLIKLESDIEQTFTQREVVTLVESESFLDSNTTSADQIKEVAIREYNNVVITNLVIESPNGTNGAKVIRISAEQVQVAFIEKAELSPEERTPRLEGTKPKVAAGTSNTTTTNTDATSEVPSAKAADKSEVKKYVQDTDSQRLGAVVDEKVAKTNSWNEAADYANAAADDMANNNLIYKTKVLSNGNVIITPMERR